MSGSGVDESRENGGGVGDARRRKRDAERVRIGKSGRVEADYLSGCTRRVNAVLAMCGGWTAQTFFASDVSGSETCAARALVFAADEDALEQSLAVWPVPPQNRQRLRLLSKRRCRS